MKKLTKKDYAIADPPKLMKKYRIAFIFTNKVEDGNFPPTHYAGAYDLAITRMVLVKRMVAVLIYSENTQIIIKRKYAFK